MAQVHIPALLRVHTQGREWIGVPGATVRDVIAALETQYPGLQGQLVRRGVAIAIDGEISSTALAEEVTAETEIQFLAAIQGGKIHCS